MHSYGMHSWWVQIEKAPIPKVQGSLQKMGLNNFKSEDQRVHCKIVSPKTIKIYGRSLTNMTAQV